MKDDEKLTAHMLFGAVSTVSATLKPNMWSIDDASSQIGDF